MCANWLPSKSVSKLSLSAGIWTAEPSRNRNIMPDFYPGNCELIPGWKCKHFPHGDELILADYKWEGLAAVNIDGYSLKNDFQVLLINCLSE